VARNLWAIPPESTVAALNDSLFPTTNSS